ncbi:MAG TPA: ABC transporter substrate-binding protein [Acetobacteraceae bacterium]|nr:ABC transporter substrate-binding protein [Acetobacteraceae bacterium]
MKLIPVLAESYEANEDGTEFVFKLRTGISFHDDTPFNAAAVKANLERVSNPANHLKRTSLFSMVDHVDALDDNTARVVLKTPFGAFIPTIAHPAAMMLSPKAIQQYGRDITRSPVGTGAFKFVSWSADTLKVTRNDKYWKPGFPKFNSVTFRSVPENGARIAMMQTGEAQFIYPVPPEMVRAIEHNPNVTVVNQPSIYARYVAMNVTKKPFDDLRVRQALNYATDKAAFARVVWSGYEDPLDSPLPPKLAFYQKPGEWPHDVEKAKKLLVDAGVPEGFQTEIWGNNNTITQRGMQFMQQQFANVGIKLGLPRSRPVCSLRRSGPCPARSKASCKPISAPGPPRPAMRIGACVRCSTAREHHRGFTTSATIPIPTWTRTSKAAWPPRTPRSAPPSTRTPRSGFGTMRPGSSSAWTAFFTRTQKTWRTSIRSRTAGCCWTRVRTSRDPATHLAALRRTGRPWQNGGVRTTDVRLPRPAARRRHPGSSRGVDLRVRFRAPPAGRSGAAAGRA